MSNQAGLSRKARRLLQTKQFLQSNDAAPTVQDFSSRKVVCSGRKKRKSEHYYTGSASFDSTESLGGKTRVMVGSSSSSSADDGNQMDVVEEDTQNSFYRAQIENANLSEKHFSHLLESTSALWKDELWDVALFRIESAIVGMDGRDLYRTIMSLLQAKKLSFGISDSIARRIGNVNDPSLSFTPKETADLCEALGHEHKVSKVALLHHRQDANKHSEGVGIPLLAVLALSFSTRAMFFNPSEIVRMANGFANSGISDHTLFSRMATVSSLKLSLFSLEETATLLRSFARIGFRHDGLMLKAATMKFSGSTTKLSKDGIIDLSFVYARFQLHVPCVMDLLEKRHIDVVDSYIGRGAKSKNVELQPCLVAAYDVDPTELRKVRRLLEFVVSCHELEVPFLVDLVNRTRPFLDSHSEATLSSIDPVLYWRSLVVLAEVVCQADAHAGSRFGSSSAVVDHAFKTNDVSGDSNCGTAVLQTAHFESGLVRALSHHLGMESTTFPDISSADVWVAKMFSRSCLVSLARVFGQWSQVDTFGHTTLSQMNMVLTHLLQVTVGSNNLVVDHISLEDLCLVAKAVRITQPSLTDPSVLDLLMPHFLSHFGNFLERPKEQSDMVYWQSLLLSARILGIHQRSQTADDSMRKIWQNCKHDEGKLQRLFREEPDIDYVEEDDELSSQLPMYLLDLVSDRDCRILRDPLPYALIFDRGGRRSILVSPTNYVQKELSFETICWMRAYRVDDISSYRDFWRS